MNQHRTAIRNLSTHPFTSHNRRVSAFSFLLREASIWADGYGVESSEMPFILCIGLASKSTSVGQVRFQHSLPKC